uniref:Uncharacterized protein n=1 Tax=Anguilla anguilla TaxID=7936 RepID=A0A0E9Y257_ANGAN
MAAPSKSAAFSAPKPDRGTLRFGRASLRDSRGSETDAGDVSFFGESDRGRARETVERRLCPRERRLVSSGKSVARNGEEKKKKTFVNNGALPPPPLRTEAIPRKTNQIIIIIVFGKAFGKFLTREGKHWCADDRVVAGPTEPALAVSVEMHFSRQPSTRMEHRRKPAPWRIFTNSFEAFRYLAPSRQSFFKQKQTNKW